jgi:hypothetical protein
MKLCENDKEIQLGVNGILQKGRKGRFCIPDVACCFRISKDHSRKRMACCGECTPSAEASAAEHPDIAGRRHHARNDHEDHRVNAISMGSRSNGAAPKPVSRRRGRVQSCSVYHSARFAVAVRPIVNGQDYCLARVGLPAPDGSLALAGVADSDRALRPFNNGYGLGTNFDRCARRQPSRRSLAWS